MKPISVDLLSQRLTAERRARPDCALNRLLYECLRAAIHDGSLPAATRLPPSRDLALQLGISRNTVMHAYEQLMAEGYAKGLTGSGTYVADRIPDLPLVPRPPVARTAPALTARLSRRGRQVVDSALAQSRQWGAFMPGLPDITQAPHRKLAKIIARLGRTQSPATLSYAAGGGHPALHRSLAVYLRQARSVVCEPSQIVVTEGVHQAIDLITRVLGDPGDTAWVEEPGYWGTRSVLAVNGIEMLPLPVDAEGMRLPDGEHANAKPPRFAFVTPSHQYPLGVVMSMARRLDLLTHATRHGTWVVEDDYDSEFRFSGQPIPSLQGLLPDAPVIYVGTFSKTLYPGLRIAYMVVPQVVAAAFRTAQAELYRGGHMLTQAALAEFIDTGLYAAHIRRMRLVYASRRAFLVELVQQWLGPDWVHEYSTGAGLHLVLSLPEGADDVAITEAVGARGVLVRPLSQYFLGPRRPSGLLLGFASVPQEEMLAAWEVVMQCLKTELSQG